uniref:Kinesin motor domain-containing protein n=1 Tax=Arcella intermedia TaxID=1963864 RepID=A0A6B2L136_9EUKA
MLSLKSEFRELKVAYEKTSVKNEDAPNIPPPNPDVDTLNMLKEMINNQLKLNEERAKQHEIQNQQVNNETNSLKLQHADREATLKQHRDYLQKDRANMQLLKAQNANLLIEKKIKVQEVRNEVQAVMDQLSEERKKMEFVYMLKVKNSKSAAERLRGLIGEKENRIGCLEKELVLLKEKLESAEKRAREDERVRRKLFSDMQHLKGNIRVIVRMRGLLPEERGDMEDFGLSGMDEQEIVVHENRTQGRYTYPFKVDRVYGADVGDDVICWDVEHLLDDTINGKHSICFFHGQSGSGKTEGLLGGESKGVIQLLCGSLFGKVEKKRKNNFIDVSLNVVRISNEEVHDLLYPEQPIIPIESDKARFALPNSCLVTITDFQSASELLAQAHQNRETVPIPLSNESHYLYRFHITQSHPKTKENISSVFSIVELAGSEYNFTGINTEDKTKIFINPKIQPLANVIVALAGAEKNVPYKASKLTQILSAEMSSATMLFCSHLSPSRDHMKDTLNSLRFAAKLTLAEIPRKNTTNNKETKQ